MMVDIRTVAKKAGEKTEKHYTNAERRLLRLEEQQAANTTKLEGVDGRFTFVGDELTKLTANYASVTAELGELKALLQQVLSRPQVGLMESKSPEVSQKATQESILSNNVLGRQEKAKAVAVSN
ncbi:unnamed protein product [Linum trigynum]|uniref:Uncharacterized protein n=1 Tax=Linum trigynum TaxID=586398 RepID=A0AAV2GMB4_9ROSI